ncbi:MAG: benzoylsuccinyl-CoA thiolase [Nevskiaceae bacterium]|nr:MAG: benzoylsuccinyl-CoA thiolase [Nevskiaceae bacterium]TBR71389.1 MAG: benzoylsuccinyl-CoA thiolase [Nevskiaceae bacterium]
MDAPTPARPLMDGWFTLDPAHPHLLGNRCTRCGTYYFPKLRTGYCRNPDCDGETFEEIELSNEGTLWSYTDAAYAPPPPYVAADPHVPFGIAAVQLEKERMVVLGQLATGTELRNLELGQPMKLVLEALEDGRLVWKWQPLEGAK